MTEWSRKLIDSSGYDRAGFAEGYDRHRPRPPDVLLETLCRYARVERPALVVDLGCGPGELTLGLASRWPDARVVGVDSSPQMLARAAEQDPEGRVEWVEADVATWQPPTGVDVVGRRSGHAAESTRRQVS